MSYLSPHPAGCGGRVSMTLLPTATLLCSLAIRENPRPKHPSFLGLSQESCVNQYLCNNKANLLTRLETCCNRILGTRPRMTGARGASLLPPIILLLCLLLPKVSFFLPNPIKTCWTTENVPLIRRSGFAERERDLCLAYFSSFFPLKISYFTHLFYTSPTP